MLGNSFWIGSVRGIRLGVHPSWLIVLVFFTWSLARSWFPSAYPGWSPETYWATGAVATLLLFGSVLLHEFGHALTALRLGVPVRSIVLFIFGGVATLERESDRPGKEFWIAVMGPVVSLVLAGTFYALRFVVAPIGEPVLGVVTYLAVINGLLAAFNMIPGFPLDGGRILRAIVWGATGNYKRATFITSVVGQVVAYILIFLGVYRVLGGNLFGGLWTTFVGWFLLSAASLSYKQAEIQDSLSGVRVRRLLRSDPPTVPPHIPLSDLVYNHILPNSTRAHLVVEGDRLLGMVTLTDVNTFSHPTWAGTTVFTAMTPADRLKMVHPDAPLTEALQLLAGGDYNQLPVVDDGRVAGLLSRSDLMRYMSLRLELGIPGDRSGEAGTRAETMRV